MRKIIYNSQRNNINFAGKFQGWKQCFSTCAWMFLSYYDPRGINVADDKALAEYVDGVEASVGKPGIAEKIRERYNWIKGNTSTWWMVQQAGIQERLPKHRVQFADGIPLESLRLIIDQGPIIIGTNKLGGLPGGHIILLVDFDPLQRQWIVNDPYGNALTGYESDNGDNIRYAEMWLRRYIDIGCDTCRIIYI